MNNGPHFTLEFSLFDLVILIPLYHNRAMLLFL